MSSKTILVFTWFIIASFLFALPASAFYKWVDEKGEVRVTDEAPPGSPRGLKEYKEQEEPGPLTSPAVDPDAADETTPPRRIPVRNNPQPTVEAPNSSDARPVQSGQSETTAIQQPLSSLGTASVGGEASSITSSVVPPVRHIPQMPRAAEAGFSRFYTAFKIAGGVVYFYLMLCFFLIARQLAVPHAWLSWIPIVQVWAFVGSAKHPWWYGFLFLVPLLNIFIYVYLSMEMVENLNRNRLLGLLMLIPGVNLVYLGVLAFTEMPDDE